MTASERASQIERDFNVPHPTRRLVAGLNRKDSRTEVTPYHERVARERIRELVTGRGLAIEDACIVLMMRGARREVLARVCGYGMRDIAEWVADVFHRLNGLNEADLDSFIWIAQENLDLMRRA